MEDAYLSINIEYKFSSNIGSRQVADCIKEYKAILYTGVYADNTLNEFVGEVDFKLIYLVQAMNEKLDIYELFDTYEYTFRHGQEFYDFNKGSFKSSLLKEFPDLEFICGNICIIETMGILPQYRGKRLGAKVFKDLVWNFGHICGLFILQPYPLQFEHLENNTHLLPKLELERFEKDEKKATSLLSKYYQSWGLKKIHGIKDLLFYSSLYQNSALDDIDMDDY